MTWAEKFEAQAVERGLQRGLEEGRERGMQEGIQEGRQKGRQEGRQEGMREMLLYQLERRFPPLPDEVSRRLSAIDSQAELTRLAEKVISARSLEELGLA
jgi:flagellar biosynthesis/type III secretory pathway protein FliH